MGQEFQKFYVHTMYIRIYRLQTPTISVQNIPDTDFRHQINFRHSIQTFQALNKRNWRPKVVLLLVLIQKNIKICVISYVWNFTVGKVLLSQGSHIMSIYNNLIKNIWNRKQKYTSKYFFITWNSIRMSQHSKQH